jgi:peptide/nickel transport system substrate-binding protein
MRGLSTPSPLMIAPELFSLSKEFTRPKLDPDGAKKLLAEAGYPNGFELVLGSPNDRYINDEKVAQAVAQMLTRIGIKTSVDSMTASTFFTRRNKFEFSAYLAGWGADTGELSNSLVALVATFDPQTGFGGTNRGRYSNKAMDEVVRKALATIDDKAREALLQQAARMVQEDVGIIPLHFEVTPWAFRKGLGYVPRVDQYTLAFEVKPTP